MSKKHTKWHKLRKETEADVSVGPVITEAQTNRLYRNTQIGSPVDTIEELDMQRNNLGPKDSLTELQDSDKQPNKHSKTPTLEPMDDAKDQNNEHLDLRPTPKP